MLAMNRYFALAAIGLPVEIGRYSRAAHCLARRLRARVGARLMEGTYAMRIDRRSVLGMLVALPLALAGPGFALAQGTPQAGGTLVMVVHPDPPPPGATQSPPPPT